MPKVLLLTWDDSLRERTERTLGTAGFEVVTEAPSWPACYQRAQQERPDVVAVDLGRRAVHGRESAAGLRGMSATEELPVVLFRVEDEKRARARVPGVPVVDEDGLAAQLRAAVAARGEAKAPTEAGDGLGRATREALLGVAIQATQALQRAGESLAHAASSVRGGEAPPPHRVVRKGSSTAPAGAHVDGAATEIARLIGTATAAAATELVGIARKATRRRGQPEERAEGETGTARKRGGRDGASAAEAAATPAANGRTRAGGAVSAETPAARGRARTGGAAAPVSAETPAGGRRTRAPQARVTAEKHTAKGRPEANGAAAPGSAETPATGRRTRASQARVTAEKHTAKGRPKANGAAAPVSAETPTAGRRTRATQAQIKAEKHTAKGRPKAGGAAAPASAETPTSGRRTKAPQARATAEEPTANGRPRAGAPAPAKRRTRAGGTSASAETPAAKRQAKGEQGKGGRKKGTAPSAGSQAKPRRKRS